MAYFLTRYGFNSDGIDSVKKRLQKRIGERSQGIVGVNVGKNKTAEDPVEDFVQGIKELGEYADYVVINVSSPNTPGLRKMQGKEQLQNLILKVNRKVSIKYFWVCVANLCALIKIRHLNCPH